MRKCCYDSNNKKSKFHSYSGCSGWVALAFGTCVRFFCLVIWFTLSLLIVSMFPLRNWALQTHPLIKGCCEYFTAPFGKRSWKMFYCTLRDPLVMYLHKDERGFHKNQVWLMELVFGGRFNRIFSPALWQRPQCHSNTSRAGDKSKRLHQKAVRVPVANFGPVGVSLSGEFSPLLLAWHSC